MKKRKRSYGSKDIEFDDFVDLNEVCDIKCLIDYYERESGVKVISRDDYSDFVKFYASNLNYDTFLVFRNKSRIPELISERDEDLLEEIVKIDVNDCNIKEANHYFNFEIAFDDMINDNAWYYVNGWYYVPIANDVFDDYVYIYSFECDGVIYEDELGYSVIFDNYIFDIFDDYLNDLTSHFYEVAYWWCSAEEFFDDLKENFEDYIGEIK